MWQCEEQSVGVSLQHLHLWPGCSLLKVPFSVTHTKSYDVNHHQHLDQRLQVSRVSCQTSLQCTSNSIIFCYIYTITFFGAFLTLNGRREASSRHRLTCVKIPSDNHDYHPEIWNICCVGGGEDKNTGAGKKQPASNFFKDYYGPFLIKPWIRGV